jgi:nicotinamidase-related amidase
MFSANQMKNYQPGDFITFAYKHLDALRALPAQDLADVIHHYFGVNKEMSAEDLAAFALRYFDWEQARFLTQEEHQIIKLKEPKTHSADLHEKLRKAAEFFSPENLAELVIKFEGQTALLVVDVQKQFCDPACSRGTAHTAEVSHRIQSLVPEFRKAGIPVYAIYYSAEGEKPIEDVDFYEFQPEAQDIPVAKNANSAFQGSNIKQILSENGHRLLLTCGFNFNACVKDTVNDARMYAFKVCVLEDLVGNDKRNQSSNQTADTIAGMQERDVIFASSDTVLQQLCAHSPRP